jgi:TolB-like protein/tetratricopeptide (TPR) repeat protein
MVDKTLGHYQILGKLGSGGMGDVYRALDPKLDRELAIKVLPEHLAQDQRRRSRFMLEAQAVAKLKHPNIVTIHTVEEADGIPFLTMEYVEGKTLAAMIPRDGFDAETFFSQAIALADAVSAAHDEGITHRDLKPANIMFDKAGRLKVLDFGLAKMLADSTTSPDDATIAQVSNTVAGQILGTAAYMSPEQAEGKAIDHRSDIFSLGIVLYEMATGLRPFTGDTQMSTLTAILRDTPASISEIRHNLPRHLGRIIHRCLEKDPDRRFQTAKDVRNELEGLKKEIDSGITQMSESSITSVAAPPRRSRPWLPWALGAVAVAVIAVVFWGMRPTGIDDSPGQGTEPGAFVTTTPTPAISDAADDRKMVVVLPFENLGPPEEAYFAAGMTEEITSRLAKIGDLGVISRTSATQYDRAGKTTRQIAEDLGVDFVVEGTVRWARAADGQDRVRITPKLIRVTDDTQLWSESFDRQIDDIFAVQTEIASQVIDQMGVSLVGSEHANLAEAPTDNLEAYELYLQAKDYRNDNWVEYDRRRVEMLDKVVALDPGFLEAWTDLSSHHSGWYMEVEKTDERLDKSRVALQRAEAIDPDHPSTHLARGHYFYRGLRDYDRALEEYETASRLAPNDVRAMESVAYIYRRQGKMDQHLQRLEAAFRLDPQNANMARNLAESYRAQRRFDVALPMYERAERLDPLNYRYRVDRVSAMLAWKGDLAAARKILEEKPNPGEFWYQIGWLIVHIGSREYAEAVDWARQIDDGSPQLHYLSTIIMADIAARYGVDDPDAPSLKQAARLIEERLEEAPTDDGVRAALARNLAVRGEFDAAVREARLAVDLAAKDAFSGPERLEDLAEVYTLAGRHDEAIAVLERLLMTVYEDSLTKEALRLFPVFDPLRGNPQFEKLLSEMGS